MAARTLDQILTELKPTYAAQTQSLQEQANLIPKQIEAEEGALNAKKDQAFTDILSGARRRGLGFSGIPLGEQAMYASTEYAPALARLRNAGHERALSLQQAILGINERRDTLAQQIYQQEQDRAFQAEQARLAREAQERQAAASRAAAAASAAPTLGSIFGNMGQSAQPAQQKGFIGNNDYRGRLAWEAQQGDQDAKIMLNYVGNDGMAGGGVPIHVYQILKRNGIGGNYFATTPGVKF